MVHKIAKSRVKFKTQLDVKKIRLQIFVKIRYVMHSDQFGY